MFQRRSVLHAVLLLLCAAAQALAAPDATSPPASAPTSFENACAQAQQRDTPVLLEFYTEW